MINLARRLLKGAAAFLVNRVQAISGHSTGTQTDIAYGCAVDSGGNYLLTGIINQSPVRAWVAKFDASQTLLWQREQSLTVIMTTGSPPYADTSDNVYIACYGYVSAAPYLPHLLKYNSSGTLQWQRKLTHASYSITELMLVTSAAGDSYLAVSVVGLFAYIVLAKYNSSGTLQWQRKLTATSAAVCVKSMAFAADGGLILCGYTASSQPIVVKYNTAGAIQWQSKIHWVANGEFTTVAVDSTTGDIYLGGGITSDAVVATHIIKLNSAGTHQWTRKHPTTSSTVQAMSVDATTGNIYLEIYASAVRYWVCMDSDGNVVWERTPTADTGAVVPTNHTLPTATELLLACYANHADASQATDAVLLRMPLGGGATSISCDYIDIATPSATSYTTPAAPTVEAAGLTDAAGDLTDAAGTATDAAGTMTFTNYTS